MTAYINKNKKQYPVRENLDRKFYNTTAWVNCRTYFLVHNPRCQRCLGMDIIRLAQEVHHIKPLSSVDTLEEKFTIGLDVNNLQALCKDCHHEIHNHSKQ